MKTLDQLTAAELTEVLKHKLAIEKILAGKKSKKTPDGEVKTRKPMSEEGKAKIKQAQLDRWAKIHAEEAKAEAEAKAKAEVKPEAIAKTGKK